MLLKKIKSMDSRNAKMRDAGATKSGAASVRRGVALEDAAGGRVKVLLDGSSEPAYIATGLAVEKGDGVRLVNDGGVYVLVSDNAVKRPSPDSVVSTEQRFYSSTSATELQGGSWSDSQPAWQQGRYIWAKYISTYGDGRIVEGAAICITGNTGADGKPGADGAPGISLEVESDAGTVFKAKRITTTLTARVYAGGAELSAQAVAALGTIRWYADGAFAAEGATCAIDADKATMRVVAQLEA